MKNNKVAFALTLILASATALAEDVRDAHWYLGSSIGYISPDNDRAVGNNDATNIVVMQMPGGQFYGLAGADQ